MIRRIRAAAIIAALAALALVLSACTNDASSQDTAQSTTNAYSKAAQAAVPYPLNQMESGGWTERRLLTENLLRQNDPNAIHWVYLMTPQGQLVAQWTIKGMVFSPNSQLTNSQTISWSQSGGSGVVDAPGDNGTWGPEAFCYAFFTTSNVEIKLPCNGMVPIESDAPLNMKTTPLITYDANQAPSVNHGGLTNIGGGH